MMGFFASPAKAYLKKQIEISAAKANGGKAVKVEKAKEEEPVMGLPPDPEGDFEEVVREVKDDIETWQRRGLGRTETMPLPDTKGL